MSLASQDTPRGVTERPRRRRLATAADVADMLALPLTSLYDHARERKIPGVVRIGRRVLFDLDALDTWLDAGGELGQREP